MTKLPILEEGQLRLRPITLDDTDLIVRWRNQPEVRQNFVFQAEFTRQMHETWMNQKVFTGKVIQYIIEMKSSRRPIGSVYLRDIDRENRQAEFGIWIGELEYHGLGLGTEATGMFVSFALHQLGLRRIFLRVFTENPGAIACYKKAGFSEERIDRQCVCRDGKYMDMMFMSVVNEEDTNE